MTTTITREERERVLGLLGYNLHDGVARDLLAGKSVSCATVSPEDIDRVAQALRDAKDEATNLAQGVMDLLCGKPREKPEPLLAGLTGAIATALRKRTHGGFSAGANAVVLQGAAPQWREVTETEPAIGVSALVWLQGDAEVPEVANRHERGWWSCTDGNLVMPEPTHWMPLPAPPEKKPAPAPATQSIAQPGASEAARIEALERTVAELALAVERLSGGAK